MSLGLLLALRVGGATAAAGLGALLALGAQRARRAAGALVPFAAGALLGVTLFHLLPEAIRNAGALEAALSAVVGFALFALPGEGLGLACPACEEPSRWEGSAPAHGAAAAATVAGSPAQISVFARTGLMVLLALTLHSIADGLAITAGTEADVSAGTRLGLLLTIAVSYHKVPEGMALMGLARQAGLTAAAALGITIAVELATALGALLGLAFRGASPHGLGLLLGGVAGSFLYVVLFALARDAWRHDRRNLLAFGALGLTSIAILGRLLGSG